jgi:hypothetical protein
VQPEASWSVESLCGDDGVDIDSMQPPGAGLRPTPATASTVSEQRIDGRMEV